MYYHLIERNDSKQQIRKNNKMSLANLQSFYSETEAE